MGAYVPTLVAVLKTLRGRLNGDFVPVLKDAGATLALVQSGESHPIGARRPQLGG